MPTPTEIFLLYVFIAAGLIIIPGPNVLLIIANSLKHGTRAGLITVAGTSTAMALQLIIVTLGISSILFMVTEWFHWLRWAGALYLIYLGARSLFSRNKAATTPTAARAHHLFTQGFLVSITNPKTLLFFSAFLPQFLVTSSPALPQLILLSATFLGLAIIFDSGYALLSSHLYRKISGTTQTIAKRLSGAILIAAGLLFGSGQSETKP